MRRSADLLGCAVLTLTLQFNGKVSAGGATCRDIKGVTHESGNHYIPGPNHCTICICDNGNPKDCKGVYCKYVLPNKDCKTVYHHGDPCCENFCLDDIIPSTTKDIVDPNGTSVVDGNTNYDLGLRLVASCITALLTIGLLIFLIHRLRQRKIRAGHRIPDDRRSLGSVGYLDRINAQHGVPMDDLPCNGSYPLWKPHGNYFPHGEAPPPYEEAVAAARAEQALLSQSTTPHSLTSINFPGAYLTAHNTHTNVSIVTNSQSGLPASSPTLSQNNTSSTSPLISSNNRPLSSPAAHNCYQLNPTESTASGFCAGTCTTSFSAGSNTYENLSTPVNRAGLSSSASNIAPQHTVSSSNQLLLPNSQNVPNYQQHTTLPRQGGAFTISSTLPNSSTGAHRTIPRTPATSGSLRLRREYQGHQPVAPLFDTQLVFPQNSIEGGNPSPKSTVPPAVIPSSVPSTSLSGDAAVRTNAFYDVSCSRDPSPSTKAIDVKSVDKSSTLCNYKPPLAAANEVNEDGSFDSVTCTCSAQALPPLHDDTDDYRSECENCKTATSSGYYLDNEDELGALPHETMTLQRRPEDAPSSTTPQYYRTSLTLPTNTRQRTRSTSSRGNWFSSMPESSTDSSDGEYFSIVRNHQNK